jgi:dienelactone hydrolase
MRQVIPRERTGGGRGSAIPAVMVVQAIALSVLVGYEGSLMWRAVRIFAVVAITALAIRVERRSSAPWPGAAMVAVGTVGTVVGAGIGGVHLATAGMTAQAVAGLCALVPGLVLLVIGVIALARSFRGWWRLLVVPGVLGLLVFVLYPLTVAVNATNRPATPLGPHDPSDHGLPYEDVVVRTDDGVRLSGWYVPSRNGAAVVMLHGAGSTRSAVLAHGTVLARHGYGVLMLDTRGHGRSGGRAMDLGWFGVPDLDAGVSFLTRLPDVDARRIGVVGLSMGGEQAIAAAGSDPRIKVVVAEGVTGMQAADHGWLPGGVNGAIERGLEWVLFGAADLMTDASKPMPLRDAIRAAAPTPILLIAGGDTTDEADAGRWFRQASPSTVELWTVRGSGHIGALTTEPARWEARVTAWLDAALGGTEEG